MSPELDLCNGVFRLSKGGLSVERPALVAGVVLQRLDHQGSPTYRLVSPVGKEWQAQPILYHVAVHADGRKNLPDLARIASEAVGTTVSTETVRVVIGWLAARGLIQGIDGKEIPPSLLGGNFAQVRFRMLAGPLLTQIATSLRFLFGQRWVAFLLLLSFGIRVMPYVEVYRNDFMQLVFNPWSAVTPAEVVILGSITLLVGVIHELGHAAAARSVHMTVREIGAGLHIIYPVFYTRVDNVWAGDRQQRFTIAAGGIHFQFLVGSLMWTYYIMSPSVGVALLALFNDLSVLYNFQPFLRFDGYWMISHISGVVNLARRGWGQLIEWITLGRFQDSFLHSYGPLQRVVIGIYGIGNFCFIILFVAGLVRWSVYLLSVLPQDLWLIASGGLTAGRISALPQGVVWGILVFNIGRRLRDWLAPLIRRQVARHVA